jgi:hypothetical protein
MDFPMVISETARLDKRLLEGKMGQSPVNCNCRMATERKKSSMQARTFVRVAKTHCKGVRTWQKSHGLQSFLKN